MNSIDTERRPCNVLRTEHQVILRVLGVLERLVARAETGGGFEHEALGGCVRFFRLFADACHHAKEEDLLFPILESRGIPKEGGPIGVMLYEHGIARDLTREMGDALDAVERDGAVAQQRFLKAARQYRDLLTQHIFKEDTILFNMGDRVLSDSDQSHLAAEFCEVGCRAFQGMRKEELHALADRLEAKWDQS